MTASEILVLADSAAIKPGARVLDLCCGTGGPALYVVEATGCEVVGVDRSLEAIHLARAVAETRALMGRATFMVADATRLPFAPGFDAALLLETMLAIADKAGLLREVGRLLGPGSRFVFTLEEGQPLSPKERQQIPEGDQIWLVPEEVLLVPLEEAGFRVCQILDRTAAHADLARRLAAAFFRDRARIVSHLGASHWNAVVAAHRQWVEWLTTGRVRKLAIVAERTRD